jgi:hypothetical protein
MVTWKTDFPIFFRDKPTFQFSKDKTFPPLVWAESHFGIFCRKIIIQYDYKVKVVGLYYGFNISHFLRKCPNRQMAAKSEI